MNPDPSIADLDQAIRRLSEVFSSWVQSQFGSAKWHRAKLEVRYASDGSYWNDKMRVETADRGIVSVGTTQAVRESLITLSRLRCALSWYSFVLDVNSNGDVLVDYGYDANMAEDASFFVD